MFATFAADAIDYHHRGDSWWRATARAGFGSAGAYGGAAFGFARCTALFETPPAMLACGVPASIFGSYAGERVGNALADEILGKAGK
jgi:hypothetical protein